MARFLPPPLELPSELIQIMATSSIEVQSRNESAIGRWGLANGVWAADLAEGRITFEFADHVLTGSIQLLGSFSAHSNVWQWGWANPSIPEKVVEIASRIRAYGVEQRLSALTLPTCVLPRSSVADDLASLAVSFSNLTGVYRGPSGNGVSVFLALFDLQPVEGSAEVAGASGGAERQ